MAEAKQTNTLGFRYKPRPKLEPSETLLEQMQTIATWGVSQEEAATALGCSKDTLRLFWLKHPEYQEAWEAGKEVRKIRLRRQLDMHAMSDPGTARFLAKNELGLSDDPSKARADEAQAETLKGRMARDELDKRLAELHGKMIEGTAEEIEDADGQRVARPVPALPRPQATRRPDHAGGHALAKEPPARPQTARPAGAQPKPAGVPQEEVLRRIAEIEASMVRKYPRKDGQPHTDRSKTPVDKQTNKPQTGTTIPGAPGRLPGRIS